VLRYSHRIMSSPITLPEISLQAKIATVQNEYRELVPWKNEAFDPVKLVTAFAAKGDLQSCQSEVFQLELLIKNLNDIRKPRPDVFSSLRAKIYKCGNYSNHVGLRMEARIASSLARKGVGFSYVDAPDFTVKVEGGTAFIECTGVLPADVPHGKDMRYKIASAINKKSAMPYANGSTAVAVEATSVFAAMITAGLSGDDTDLNQYLPPLLASTSLGAVLVFHVVYDREASFLRFVYHRFDCHGIALELKRLLDEEYPFVGGQIRNPFVPGARTLLPIYRADFPVWYESGTIVQVLPADGRLLGLHRHLPSLSAGALNVRYAPVKT